MALKIRLRQQGRNNRAFFRVVVADIRSPRDGRYVEALGWYNPLESVQEKLIFLNNERIQYWLDQGAELSECMTNLMKKASPELIEKQREKVLALRAKNLQKRKARNKKAA